MKKFRIVLSKTPYRYNVQQQISFLGIGFWITKEYHPFPLDRDWWRCITKDFYSIAAAQEFIDRELSDEQEEFKRKQERDGWLKNRKTNLTVTKKGDF